MIKSNVNTVLEKLSESFYQSISRETNSYLVCPGKIPWIVLKPSERDFYREITNTFIRGLLEEGMVIMRLPEDLKEGVDNEQSN